MHPLISIAPGIPIDRFTVSLGYHPRHIPCDRTSGHAVAIARAVLLSIEYPYFRCEFLNV
jgi:hypothetical protein